ncbi:Phosphate metabolism transcription protein [Saitoella coloradoensis]
MRFGAQLEDSVYEPWKDSYINYANLKTLLKQDNPEDWTENDESRFVELLDSELEKIYAFQNKIYQELKTCIVRLESEVDAATAEPSNSDKARQTQDSLDKTTEEVNQLERYSRINFTGFLKIAKKHDKLHKGYTVRPLLQVRLSMCPFNSEDYSPLLWKLSTMYAKLRENVKVELPKAQLPSSLGPSSVLSAHNFPINGIQQVKRHSYKFWVHPDNIMEVKTYILRRLPVLVYNPSTAKANQGNIPDPSITSLYFDNPALSLYMNKIERKENAQSLRLRWSGHLKEKPEIFLERKTASATDESEDTEDRIAIKEKYIKDFIDGTYSMEKQIKKMGDAGVQSDEAIEQYGKLVHDVQAMIKEHNLRPVMRAVYTRTAFQIPGDDSVRISLDTNLALIREDDFDEERPHRNPDDWHRADIDDSMMEYPFKSLKKGEINRFPYALLEIKVQVRGNEEEPKWAAELRQSHLVTEAPRFSKFAHGVAVLFDPNLLPFWLPDVEKDIRRDPGEAYDPDRQNEFGQSSNGPKLVISYDNKKKDDEDNEDAASDKSKPASSKKGKNKAANRAAPDERYGSYVMEDDTDEESADDRRLTLRGLPALFKKSNYRTITKGREPSPTRLPPGVSKPEYLLRTQGPVKVEAKVWLANERTFIKWMHVCTLLSTLALALFNGASDENKVGRWLGAIYACISVAAGAWGYFLFKRRAKKIAERSPGNFDDFYGPLGVCMALLVALGLNFGLKYNEMLQNRKKGHF